LESEREEARDERLARLVEDHLDFVWRLLRRIGTGATDADDATQQVFMIATRKLEEITPGSERTFLYGTALRVAANLRRTLRRRREVSVDTDTTPMIGRGPDEQAELARAVALLDRVLERLPVELRRVLVLAEIEELEVAEVAKLEGLKLGTAASRLRRARESFRRALGDIDVDNPFGRDEEP
jgi:RNA polymerase sigma-70 factor (ECF subfamily)